MKRGEIWTLQDRNYASDDNMYDGAKFSYDGDFIGYLGLEGMGIFTNHDRDVMSNIKEMAAGL